jgi:hypothetical protein
MPEFDNHLSELEEKARKFDELQQWFWWIERRTHGGKTSMIHLRVFMNELKKHFEPYEED